MKKVNNKITTYEHEIIDDEYEGKVCIDIVETPDSFEAWIYDENYGIKELMWGEPKNNMMFNEPYTQTFEEFKKLVTANIKDYIRSYYTLANGNES